MQIVPSSNSAFLAFGVAAGNNAPAGLMLNPDFNTGPVNGTSWMCSGNATIANGQAVFGGGGGGGFFYEASTNYLSQLVSGNKYVLAFYINAGSVGSLRAVFNSGIIDSTVSSTGLFSYPFTHNGGDSTFNFQDKGFTGSVEWCQISPA